MSITWWLIGMSILCFQDVGPNAPTLVDPPEVQKLLDKFDRDTQAIQKEADKQIATARRNLTKDLDVLQETFTKDAKLDQAIRVRDLIRKINGLIELKVLQNPESKDFLVAASAATISEAEKKGYKTLDIPQGLIFREQIPNTIPLMTYFHPQRNDYLTVATQESISSGKPEYQLVRIEGYVYQRKAPSSIPIYLFWNGKDNVTTSETMRIDLEKQAFKQIRIEGWVLKPN